MRKNGCRVTLPALTIGLLLFLLPVAAVQGQTQPSYKESPSWLLGHEYNAWGEINPSDLAFQHTLANVKDLQFLLDGDAKAATRIQARRQLIEVSFAISNMMNCLSAAGDAFRLFDLIRASEDRINGTTIVNAFIDRCVLAAHGTDVSLALELGANRSETFQLASRARDQIKHTISLLTRVRP